MIQHNGSSIFKGILGVVGVLAFFLVIMHQASQLFR